MRKTSGMDLAKDSLRYSSSISYFSLSAVRTASGSKGIISVRIRDTPKVSVKLLEKSEFQKNNRLNLIFDEGKTVKVLVIMRYL
jgi:hypothetical protein